MDCLKLINQEILWGAPMLIFMLFIGAYLTFVTKGVIFLKFASILKHTLGSLFAKKSEKNSGAISPFAAVSTALAATVGTGNIAGVAAAIAIGGPGAVFWMWMSALFGMVIKYCEVTLSLHFREKNKSGEYVGGPMYYITKGLKLPRLAAVFCFFAILSSFGIGNMVQANTLALGAKSLFNIDRQLCGIILSALCGAVLIGGIRRISSVAELLVPFMALSYIILSAIVLFKSSEVLPQCFSLILKCAFHKTAPCGGFVGASVIYAMRIGVSRGLFTNEAGLGSAPIAHASADVPHPVRQGMWGAFEVFFDTIIMCTMTALVIISTDVWTSNQSNDGILSQLAFSQSLTYGGYIVDASIILFAFASIIAWYYYGEKCVEFIFPNRGAAIYRALYVLACFFGCICDNSAIWEISDTLNAFMALPNLIALFLLAPVAGKLTEDFFGKKG